MPGEPVSIHLHHHTVTADEIDHQGHVSNVRYLDWMQQAAIGHSSTVGWPPEAYTQIGAGWVARRHEIDYLRAAQLGQAVTVHTWVERMDRLSSVRRYKIVLDEDDTVIARAMTKWAFIDLETGKPQRVPTDVVDAYPIVVSS